MDQRAQQQYSKSHQRQPHQQHQQQQQHQQPRQDLYVRDSSFDSHSTDRDDDDEEEEDYEISFLEACLECDDDALYEIIRDGVTREQINERDKSGRTGLSHASANGFIPILELLGSLEDLDPNLADNDGNTPLIYAAQAGHDDVVNYLLQNMRNVRVDQCNKLGFTALMKAAIQGRTRCAKLLLFAGASPNRRDHGRGLCAEEWARFCGCHSCANSIAKYVRSKKYFFKKTFLLSKDKWSSEPDMFNCSKRGGTGSAEKPTSWIQRHLSLKKKKGRGQSSNKNLSSLETGPASESLSAVNKFGSAPILLINSYDEEIDPPAKNFRRPSCIDNVVQVSIGRRRQAHPPDDPDCGDRARGLVRNSSPGMNSMNHADPVEAQRHKDRDQLDRPPTITVGDLMNEENVCATPTAKASASDIIATSLGVRLSSKASAVVDPLRHRAASSQEDGLKSPEAQQLAAMSIKDFR